MERINFVTVVGISQSTMFSIKRAYESEDAPYLYTCFIGTQKDLGSIAEKEPDKLLVAPIFDAIFATTDVEYLTGVLWGEGSMSQTPSDIANLFKERVVVGVVSRCLTAAVLREVGTVLLNKYPECRSAGEDDLDAVTAAAFKMHEALGDASDETNTGHISLLLKNYFNNLH